MKHFNFKSLIVLFLVLIGISPNAWAWRYKTSEDSWNCTSGGFTNKTMKSGNTVDVLMLTDVGDGVNIVQNDDCTGQTFYVKWTKKSGDIFRGTARWNNGLYCDETVVIPQGKVYLQIGSGSKVQMTKESDYTYTLIVNFASSGTSYKILGDAVSGESMENQSSMPAAGKPSSLTMSNSYSSSRAGYTKVSFDLYTNKVTETEEKYYENGEYIYITNFKPDVFQDNWVTSSSHSYAYMKDGNVGAQSYHFVLVEGTAGNTSAVYGAKITTAGTYKNVIITRYGQETDDPITNYWNKTGDILLDRSKNRLTSFSADGTSATWSPYAPPLSAITLADNGTTTYGGNGTSSNPYLVEVETTIKVTATGATKKVDDINATINYDFKQSNTNKQSGTTATYSFTASSTANTSYTINLDGYTKVNTIPSTKKAATALYYKTVNIYTVTYDANDATSGSVPTDATEYVSGSSVTVKSNTGSLAKTGYDFTGWNTKADGTGTTYTAGTGTFTITANTTLYAKWTAHQYSVTLNGNGGSDGSVKATYNGGLSSYVPAQNNGKNLTGYFTSETGGTEVIDRDGKLKASIDGYSDENAYWIKASDCTLFAQWQSEATLTFDKNTTDQVENLHEPITQNPGDVTLPAGPTRVGYTFTSWNTLANGQGIRYNAGEPFNLQANTILFAQWQINTHKLTWVTDGDDLTGDYTHGDAIAYGTTIVKPNTPTKTGYTFKDWTNEVPETMPDNDLTFTATWTPITYKVHFDGKGNTAGSMSDQDFTYDEASKNLTVNAFTKTGYTFKGWDTNSAGTIVVHQDGASVRNLANTQGAVVNLYAVWQAKTYTVSFDQNGGTGGQTESVTATYDQPMPGTVTCPTRVGYKFNGYWSQQTGGTQYYTNTGVSARTWNIDQENPTLYAQWIQLNVYIQGRFSVATNHDRNTWLHTGDGTSGWNESSTNIKMQWDETNHRYYLNTWATVKELSDKHGSPTPDFQYFNFKQCEGTSISSATEYNYGHTMPAVGVPVDMTKGGESARAHFESTDRSGYVILYFDEAQMWYEIDPITTYDVKITTYGGGSVNPSGTYKIGEVKWEITANPTGGYKFDGWTVSGGAHVEDATSATTKVTATGDGEVSANFQQLAKIYFQKTDNWGTNPAYIYFYKNNYWNDSYGTGSDQSSCVYGPVAMQWIDNNIFDYSYDVNEMLSRGWDGIHVAITHKEQYNKGNFDDNNIVVYCNNFDACGNTLIKMGDFNKSLNNAHYYQYSLENMSGAPSSYYIKFQSENWKSKDENMFQYAKEYVVEKQYNAGDKDEFKVWYNACGKWYGMTATINEDVTNWQMYDNDNHNVKFEAWKTGGYSFKFDINSKQISVTYLGDITVANFPGEVSTFVNRQYKVKSDVTLRNGTKVTDVTITVTHKSGNSNIATYEQNGTNLIITGKAIGTEIVTVTYQNNKETPYVVERDLKVNVAEPIVIQAELTEGDTKWTNTGLVHIHFWGNDAETAQDLSMSYNKDTKVFSVTAPMITNPFNFMFWYGEDINTSANEQWRKTGNISATTSTCYTISNGTDNNATRTATPETGLCSEDEYYVEITMKNGNTYKSNTISDDLSKKVSFFAPKSNDATYTGGTVRIVHNGVVSDPITTGFDSAYVYVATINSGANGFATLKAYNGNYYIRTDGAGGMWNDYKTNDDNIMIEFTPRAEKGETFSYYWVKNVAKTGTGTDGKVNVKADVANDYNDNLAGMIENDKFTDGGGYVYESTNGANVRFSYEPTTNEFKRAILGGAGNNNFLNVYSKTNNLYADNEYSKQLSESADLNDSKFSDLSDWVYEKRVYVRADGAHASKVILKSVFNGQTTHLLGYAKNEKGEDTDVPNELEVMGSQSTGDFALRITYDFKKNRLIASWEPGQREISENMIIDSDVLFVQQEAADGTIDNTDVAQITYSQTGIDANAKLTSLKNMIYVLEVTDKVIDNTDADNQLYWICLPFDCRISDIYGVEGYVKLDAGGRAISGTWGIQRYDGANRATHGWFIEDNPQGFWKWMTRDEILKAGTGYVVVFDKTGAGSWPSIDVEEACEGESNGCKDGKKTVQKRSKRLYFPSIGSKFEISYSGSSTNVVEYANEPCNITQPVNRTSEDGNWKVIGPVSYNNIGVDQGAANNLTFYYTYSQDNALVGSAHYTKYAVESTTVLKSFHGYMTQFGGNLTWKPFTKSDDVTGKAPLYAVAESEFKGGMLTIELNNAQGEQLDRTFVNLHKNGTLGFDQNMELTQITENCAQIASVCDNVLYAGSTLPLDIELVPLNVKVTANGTYDIALKQSLEGLEVKLFDAFEQTTTLLDLMPATVTLEKGEYKDRFFLQFTQKAPQSPTSLDGSLEQYNLPMDKTQKLLINGNIYLINGGRVYNATGAELR